MVFLDPNELPSLDSYDIINEETSYFPSILDLDPVYAAESLTIHDSEDTILKLTECLNAIRNNKENNYPILATTICHSTKNYQWFCSFHKKLEQLVTGNSTYKYPILDLEPKKGVLQVYPPLQYSMNKVTPIAFRTETLNPIDLHRVNYIRKDIELEDFRDGFPNWYLLKDTTVFERYNEITNTRVRIDFKKGEFKYYLSGASDNWKQIIDVPLEMDHVVSALLFHTRN